MLARRASRVNTHRITPKISRSIECRRRFSSETVAPDEVAKFARLANDWWRPDGHAALLHRMNPVRVGWIRRVAIQELNNDAKEENRIDPYSAKPFRGLRILDVGCGGGLLSESLARLGGSVTGIDVTKENINICRAHAALDPLFMSEEVLKYRLSNIEELAAECPNHFDIVCSLEVIEHVADVGKFLESIVAVTKPNGLIFLSTINRTPQAFALAVGAAEYLLRWVPPGTHDWNKFIHPTELTALLRRVNANTKEITGLHYNPLLKEWSLTSDTSVNYMLYARKASEPIAN